MIQSLIPPVRKISRTRKSNVVLDAHQFERELAREKVRSTRRSIPFCVLYIDLNGEQKKIRRARRLTSVLLERNVRITDSIAQLGPRQFAILLTDTPEMGGRCVVDRLMERFTAKQLSVEFHLSVHDLEGFSPEDSEDDDNDNTPKGNHRERWEQSTPSWKGDGQISLSEEISTDSRGPVGNLMKRTVDVVGASAGLLVAGPFLLAAMAAIRLSDGEPAVFKQTREGRGGKPFTIYKLRTMVVNAEDQQAELRKLSHRDGPAFKIDGDPRVTKIGNFLRKTCLDELPQLWNILVGDMSIVGPRPLPWHESRACHRWQRRRLEVRPGLTCYWQINKGAVESFDDWMRLDLQYLKRGTLLEDLKLMLLTARVPISGRGGD